MGKSERRNCKRISSISFLYLEDLLLDVLHKISVPIVNSSELQKYKVPNNFSPLHRKNNRNIFLETNV